MDYIYHEVLKLMSCFPGSFINRYNEIIFYEKENIYFSLRDVDALLILKCKIFEWLSRPAHKGTKNKTQDFILKGINKYLGTSFTKEDMSIIYTPLGNNVNRTLCVKFVNNNYDLELLKNYINK